MTTVLVTGAGGYLGSRLGVRLAEEPSLRVRTLVRRLVPYLPARNQIVGDLLEHEADVAPIFKGVDIVVHLAGANEALARDSPERALTTTIAAAQRVADLGAAAGVQRIVFVSTIHVYGDAITEDAALSEETLPCPRSIYAIARLTSEYLVQAFEPATEAVVFRVSNLVGAPLDPSIDRWSLVANDLCRNAAVHDRVELRSDGTQWRDFVALEDVTRILQAALDRDSVPAGTYNLGSGKPVTIRSLAGIVQDSFEELTGRRPMLIGPGVPSEPPQPYRLLVDRIGQLGFAPRTTLKAAVLETARFCLEHRGQL